VVAGFVDALQTTFLAAVPFAVLGFAILLFLRETPCASTTDTPWARISWRRWRSRSTPTPIPRRTTGQPPTLQGVQRVDPPSLP
jgi:hypothetical protein